MQSGVGPWDTSAPPAALAAAEGKRILSVPLAELPPAQVDRLTRMAFVSTTVRNHRQFERVGESVSRDDRAELTEDRTPRLDLLASAPAVGAVG